MSIFPTRLLLATDSSREAQLAATTAADLAERTNSELHLITVGSDLPLYELPDYPAPFEDVLREQRRETKELLEEQVKKVQESGGTVNETYLREGSVDEEIVELAEEIGAGLIVMGSRGHGRIRRALMGSVSDSVVRHAHCPVLVVRADPIVFPAKMLVATDGSKEAELASSSAADLAKKTGSELHVVHVGHIPPALFLSAPCTSLRMRDHSPLSRNLLKW
jgi:nucleotide-binding universal stress UspA family protein